MMSLTCANFIYSGCICYFMCIRKFNEIRSIFSTANEHQQNENKWTRRVPKTSKKKNKLNECKNENLKINTKIFNRHVAKSWCIFIPFFSIFLSNNSNWQQFHLRFELNFSLRCIQLYSHWYWFYNARSMKTVDSLYAYFLVINTLFRFFSLSRSNGYDWKPIKTTHNLIFFCC